MPNMQETEGKIMNNLFKLAEKQLQKEKNNRKRKDYTLLDIIDYAVMIRKHLDYKNRAEKIAEAKRSEK